MTDPVLAALLADPTPTGRLVAADAFDEAGEALASLCCRLAGTLPADEVGNWMSSWRLSRRIWLRESRWFVDSSLVSELSLYFRGRRTCPQRHHLVSRRCAGYGTTPPPALEAAVLSVLRRRLEEMQR